jgi:hypothetical protein
MRNLQGLPLADPSVIRLGGSQYPGLFCVACANNVGVVCVATNRAEQTPTGAFGAPITILRQYIAAKTGQRPVRSEPRR